ncbi:uncharacterized protein A4U43_C05F9050 [Asparagus officinalis]|uniref:Uncharacterized protein n=1 Tax=Asparagus officinalis TaxID=4686 RepID=A0A5P1EVS8_ASPOF|nr:uncharacterized protein A4U43_C05F9050 [Asparagus officinalis]
MSSPGGHQPWQSPTPYIFGGLASVMGLILIALIVLVCSDHKSSDGDENSRSQPEAPAAVSPVEREAKVMVVIMAGDDEPTFLAKPYDVEPTTSVVVDVAEEGYNVFNQLLVVFLLSWRVL